MTLRKNTEVIRLDPNEARAYRGRGIAYSAKGDYDDAIADYTEANRLDPKDAVTYAVRGTAYSAKDDYDRAIADFTDAIRPPHLQRRATRTGMGRLRCQALSINSISLLSQKIRSGEVLRRTLICCYTPVEEACTLGRT